MTDKFCTTQPLVRKRWSPSSLQDAGQCWRKYQLAKVQGWRLPGQNIKMEAGRFLHEGLARFDTLLLEQHDDEFGRGNVPVALDGALEFMFGQMGTYGPDMEPHPDYDSADAEYTRPVWHPWETGDTKLNRWTLLRALIDYADTLGGGSVQPKALPGTAMTEVKWEFPLDIVSPDGDPYILTGFFDGPVGAGIETFIRERKVTGGSVSGFYFDMYSLGPQVDSYDLAGEKLWPDERLHGVMLEVIQIGVNFTRVQRRIMARTPAQRAEWQAELQQWIKEGERIARHYGDNPWPMRRSNCNMFGGCQFRGICDKDPSQRERFLRAGFEKGEV